MVPDEHLCLELLFVAGWLGHPVTSDTFVSALAPWVTLPLTFPGNCIRRYHRGVMITTTR